MSRVARDTGEQGSIPAIVNSTASGIARAKRSLPRYESSLEERLSYAGPRTPGGVTFRVAVAMRRRRRDEAGGQDIVELAALADGSLAPERRAALEARVAASPELAERLAEQQRAVAFAQGAAAEVEAPAALRARINAQRQARLRPARVSRRLVLVPAAAAAALALVTAVASGVFGSGAAGNQFHAALASTPLAPGAGGDATLTKTTSGWQIELDAPGLPRLDKGQFYEAWLKSADDVLVPIGTFNEGRKLTLWAGVSPVDFSTLTVTRERADGNQASSGKKVLVGTIDTG